MKNIMIIVADGDDEKRDEAIRLIMNALREAIPNDWERPRLYSSSDTAREIVLRNSTSYFERDNGGLLRGYEIVKSAK